MYSRKPIGSRFWNALYGFLSVIAVLALMLPFYSMFLPAFALSLPVCAGIMAGLYLIGYALGKLTRFGKKTDYDFSFSGDRTEKPGLRNCALPGIISIGLTVGLMFPVNAYLRTLPQYERFSFLPTEAALLIAGALLCGVITSVRPFYQIVGFRTLLTHIGFFVGYAVFCGFTGQAATVTVGCLAVWVLCAAILFNQTSIIKIMAQARIGEVKSRSRIYNLGILLTVLLSALAVTALTALIGNGLYFLGKTILFVILYALLNRQTPEEERVTDDPVSEGRLFGDGLFQSNEMNEMSLWLLILLIVLVLFIAIFGRRLQLGKKLRRLLSAFFNGILSILSSLAVAIGIFRASWWDQNDIGKLPDDYQDTEGKQDPSAIYEHASHPAPHSYRAYRRALSSKKTEHEKLAYAYRTLIGCFREQSFGLYPGDTPREICGKVTKKLSFPEAEAVTQAFEAIEYGESRGERGDYPAMTQKISELIRKYAAE